MDEIEQHQQKLLTAFASVLKAEEALNTIKTRAVEAERAFKAEASKTENELEAAWESVKGLMEETGEVEILLPGVATDFKIGWSTPRETVKVAPDAVPDQFVKVERTPKLKEIGEHLKQLREAGSPFPNWASFQLGKSKLGWKAVKKSISKT